MRFSHPRGEVLDGISTPKRGDGVIGGGGGSHVLSLERKGLQPRNEKLQYNIVLRELRSISFMRPRNKRSG